MNIKELSRRLMKLGIPTDAYTLQGGLPNDRLCLSHADSWEVYYSDQGRKSDLRRFAREEEACVYMLFRLCGMCQA